MLASDIPPDVWTAISSYIVHPKNHITLSHICQSSRSIYDGEDTWKHLCRSIGVGRGTQEKAESWKKVFMEVVGHRDRCRLPQCYEYGVPPMRTLGDLLPSSQAALEHYEYFKRKEAEQAKKCPCPCGHQNMDGDPFMHMFAHAMGHGDHVNGNDEEGDDNAEEDQEDEEDGSTPTAPHGNGLPPVPPSMAPFAHLGQLFATIGYMAVDPMTGLPSITIQPPVDGTSSTSANPRRKKKAVRSTIEPRLLPLSLKHEAYVPSRPHLHHYLAEMGHVHFKHFLEGGISLNSGYVRLQYARETPASSWGMDWEGKEDDKEDMASMTLDEHPLLARAFATNPPVTQLTVMIEILEMKVINKDGVTIRDVVHHLSKFLSKRMTLKDHERGCGCHPPMVQCLDLESRFAYLMDYIGVGEGPSSRIKPEDCFLRGIVNLCETTGETSMMLLPQ